MKTGKLRHIAISVPDTRKSAAFYQTVFGMERVSESSTAVRLSDGTVNLTLLDASTNPGARDSDGRKFIGLHHIGFWVHDIDAVGETIRSRGGTFDATEEDEAIVEGAQRKYRDPDGVMLDLSALGWSGARAEDD